MRTFKFLALSAVLSASFLFAQTNGPMPFSSFDTNGDGIITQSEFSYMKNERMKEKYEEGRLLRNSANSPNFGEIDKNGDGKINRNEYQIHQENQFKKRIEQRNKMMYDGESSGMGMGIGGGNGAGNGR